MLCYSKPKLLMTDDDDSFLSITKKYLERYLSDDSLIETFASDAEIIRHIDKNNSDYYSTIDIYQDYLKNRLPLEETLKELELYHPILIIDQNLRGKLTGTDICKIAKDKNPNISIVLLTGEIDYKTATELHNDGIIDCFFRKDESDLIKNISTAITKIINERKKQFSFDGELSVNDNIDVMLEADYRANLTSLLSDIKYKSYIITNHDGDIAIKEANNKVRLFQQVNTQGTFKEHGTSNI